MTTQDFIKKALTGDTGKDFCSSVLRYGDTVYSYGTHYPLARIINGHLFVNTRGYSNTTAKHINWAYNAGAELGLKVHGVPLTNGDGLNVHGVSSSALREQVRVASLMESKKRKDTKVYQGLQEAQESMYNARLAVA